MAAPGGLRDHRRINTPLPDHASTRDRRPQALTRHSDHRVVAGVCGGIARWLGVDPIVVRIAFVVLAISGGFGVVVYLILWAALPDDRGRRGIAGVRTAVPSRDRSQRALAVMLLVVGGLLLLREMGLWIGDRFVWPAVLAATGLALAWPQAGVEGVRIPGRPRETLLANRAALVRIGAGIGAVAGGATLFAVANADLHAMGDVMLAVALTVAGVLLIFGPWWWRLGRDLMQERRGRIRSEERAEVAARIHDSVLQTLALIQQKAGDPTETARLARRQERELREWLFGGAPSSDGTLKSAISKAAAEVEDLHGVAVDVVAVGDCPVDEALEALAAAAKEALTNAAKFAGVPTVSLYVEVEPGAVTAYVRDRGAGFDAGAVPADRKGIAESIRARMERHGGRAGVRSEPGQGTEVELVMPRGPSGPSSGKWARR